MKQIRTVLIEDEERSLSLLTSMLNDLAPEVEIVAVTGQVEPAIRMIDLEKPDLVFLDIELYGQLAFKILDQVTWKGFQCIFTTAHEGYAFRAIRYSAVDYLLKPLDPEELVSAIQKARNGLALRMGAERMEVFREHLFEDTGHQRIVLPTLEGFIVEEVSSIYLIEADGNYSRFHLMKGKELLVSKNIREYEMLLESSDFFRIHRSFIVNLKHIKKYIKGNGGSVVLTDSRMFPVAVRKKEAFIRRLKQM